jgi:hypothetical protein
VHRSVGFSIFGVFDARGSAAVPQASIEEANARAQARGVKMLAPVALPTTQVRRPCACAEALLVAI